MYSVLATLTILVNLKHVRGKLPKCSQRFENYETVKDANPKLKNCSYVNKRWPICGDPITVMYAEEPPYVVAPRKGDKGVPTGLLPDICCFGCKNVTFTQVDHDEKFQHPMKADVLMPVQSSTRSDDFNENDFVPLVRAAKVVILAKQQTETVQETELTAHMLGAVLDTWPLFLIAILMAVTAGCLMWILDTWFNEEQFPRRFPKGIFEGFWWAFVTMTTVGYGDKTPVSFFARLLSIIWIFLGITMFNMYTAVLTSALDVKPQIFDIDDFSNVNVGVLQASSLGRTVALLEHAISTRYKSIHDLAAALEKDEIKGISIDANKAAYYYSELKKHVPLIRKHHAVDEIDHAYGIISKDGNLSSFINSFFLTNDDHSKSIVAYAMHVRWPSKKLVEEDVPDVDFFNSKSPMFRYTIIGLVMISFVIVTFGLGCRQFFRKHDIVLRQYITFMNSKIDLCTPTKIIPETCAVNNNKKVIADCIIELDEFVDKLKMKLNEVKEREEEKMVMSLVEINEMNIVTKT